MIFYGYFGIAFSQEASVDDPVFDQPITEEVQEKVQDSGQKVLIDSDSKPKKEPQKKSQVKPQKKPLPSKKKSPKEVFKPTEEISEDRPAPFPVDI